MTIGLAATLTKAQLDTDLGGSALEFDRAMRRVQELRHYLLITPDATLTALGYTEAEVTTIKAAFADADNVRQAYQGLIALPQQDYRLNLEQLAGDLLT